MSESRLSLRKLTLAAVIGAAYAVLSLLSGVFALTYGPVQCRFSEALTVLPFLFPEAVWGLFAGCLLTNILSPYGLLDVVFGSLATLIAALWTSRCRSARMAPLPPVLCNMVILGVLFSWQSVGFGPGFLPAFAFNAISVGVGQALSCYILGGILLKTLPQVASLRPYMATARR